MTRSSATRRGRGGRRWLRADRTCPPGARQSGKQLITSGRRRHRADSVGAQTDPSVLGQLFIAAEGALEIGERRPGRRVDPRATRADLVSATDDARQVPSRVRRDRSADAVVKRQRELYQQAATPRRLRPGLPRQHGEPRAEVVGKVVTAYRSQPIRSVAGATPEQHREVADPSTARMPAIKADARAVGGAARCLMVPHGLTATHRWQWYPPSTCTVLRRGDEVVAAGAIVGYREGLPRCTSSTRRLCPSRRRRTERRRRGDRGPDPGCGQAARSARPRPDQHDLAEAATRCMTRRSTLVTVRTCPPRRRPRRRAESS